MPTLRTTWGKWETWLILRETTGKKPPKVLLTLQKHQPPSTSGLACSMLGPNIFLVDTIIKHKASDASAPKRDLITWTMWKYWHVSKTTKKNIMFVTTFPFNLRKRSSQRFLGSNKWGLFLAVCQISAWRYHEHPFSSMRAHLLLEPHFNYILCLYK